jgi:hypothetical protein
MRGCPNRDVCWGCLGNPDHVVQSEYGRAVGQLNILDDRAINLVLFPKRGTMIRSGCKTRRKCVKPAKQASEALSAILVGGNARPIVNRHRHRRRVDRRMRRR